MRSIRFQLDAEVRGANQRDVLAAARSLLPGAEIEETELGFTARRQIEGESARDINRAVRSALRRVDRRTTLRAGRTSGGTVERFVDYVPKGARSIS